LLPCCIIIHTILGTCPRIPNLFNLMHYDRHLWFNCLLQISYWPPLAKRSKSAAPKTVEQIAYHVGDGQCLVIAQTPVMEIGQSEGQVRDSAAGDTARIPEPYLHELHMPTDADPTTDRIKCRDAAASAQRSRPCLSLILLVYSPPSRRYSRRVCRLLHILRHQISQGEHHGGPCESFLNPTQTTLTFFSVD
jgi:hypothetical protein